MEIQMLTFEDRVVRFYLNCKDDDAEKQTCMKFDIDEDTLNYILMSDLHDSFWS